MMSHSVLIVPKVEAPGLDQAFLSARQWETIPGIPLVRAEDGEMPSLPTQLHIAWSERGMHLHFRCTDPLPPNNASTTLEQDMVGVALDPQGERDEYMLIFINPYGQVTDARIENRLHRTLQSEADDTWDYPGMHLRTGGEQSAWSVEMLLPFSGMTPAVDMPSPGDRWTGNFYRLERQSIPEVSAWQPVMSTPPDLHASDHFGILEFAG